jgi:hypothetical protein
VKQDKNTLEQVANNLIKELKAHDIGAYIWHKATTNSVYIRFDDVRMNSVRIADHNGRPKLRYMFNIRSDGKYNKGAWIKNDQNKMQYFVGVSHWREILTELVTRFNTVQDWEKPRYNYTIPKFKKKDK